MDDDLLAIEVDADDYAEIAAGESPSVDRTFQSEADFAKEKASYSAKIDDGNQYAELLKTIPYLGDQYDDDGSDEGRVKLNKKEFQLLGYAVGEMYFDKKYEEILELCERVRGRCAVDARLGESLGRWEGRCRERMEARSG